MNVAIDTNRLSDYFRGDEELGRQLGLYDSLCVPFPVIGEIRSGYLNGSREAANEARLRTFLSKSTVKILHCTRETVDLYARIHGQLRRAGTPVPINDLWIAAICLEHDLTLITRDRHFNNLPQLLVRTS